MEKKVVKKNNTWLIVLLILIILGLIGYICYDKFIDKANNNNDELKENNIDKNDISIEPKSGINFLKSYYYYTGESFNLNVMLSDTTLNVNCSSQELEDGYQLTFIINDNETKIYIDDKSGIINFYNVDDYLVIKNDSDYASDAFYLFDHNGKLLDKFNINEFNNSVVNKNNFEVINASPYYEFNIVNNAFVFESTYSTKEYADGITVVKFLNGFCKNNENTLKIKFELHCNQQGFITNGVSNVCSKEE